MTCLECSKELPASLFEKGEKPPPSKSGRFACPSCGAEHVRREIGSTPDGKPLYSLRLWGHPSSRRKKKEDRGGP